jgi:hypothetical protein
MNCSEVKAFLQILRVRFDIVSTLRQWKLHPRDAFEKCSILIETIHDQKMESIDERLKAS